MNNRDGERTASVAEAASLVLTDVLEEVVTPFDFEVV